MDENDREPLAAPEAPARRGRLFVLEKRKHLMRNFKKPQ